MKRFLPLVPLALIAFACGCSAPKAAVPPPTAADRAQVDRMMYFYLRPDVDSAINMLSSLERIAASDSGAAMPVLGFVFGVAHSMRADAGRLRAAAAAHPTFADVICKALDGKNLSDAIPASPLDLTASHMDFVWGYFFASGDASAARLVIERGAIRHIPDESSLDGMISVDITAETAKWSVRRIAEDHAKVRAELNAFALTAGDEAIVNFFGYLSAPKDARADLRAKTTALLSPAASKRVSEVISLRDAQMAGAAEGGRVEPERSLQ